MSLRDAVVVLADADAVARRAAEDFLAAARDAQAARGVFTVALTGGTSPLGCYAVLASGAAGPAPDWTRVEVFWGDERAVPPDAPESNYGGAARALLAPLGIPADRVHRMAADRADLEAAAEAYAATLRARCGGAAVPVVDLLMLGLGADAHVLSMHPGCADLRAPRALVVALRDPPMRPALSRLSVTPPVVHAARAVLVLAHGAAKAPALAAMVDGPLDVPRVPAQLVRAARGRVTILCDAAAAADLAPA